MTQDATPGDVWRLARAMHQYRLQPVEWARLREAFPDLEFNGDAAHNARLIADYLEAKQQLQKLVFAVNPDEAPKEAQQYWEWHSISEAFEPRPEREYVVGGLFAAPSLSVIFGAPATYKTWFLMDIAVSVAAGREAWLDGLPDNEQQVPLFECHSGPVLWVDVDNGLGRLLDRFEAIGRAYGIDPPSTPLSFVSFPFPALIASDEASIGLLVEQALLFEAKLIVLDNLGTISGEADENSSAMIAVMSGLRRLAEATQAAVVVVHHANKYKGDIRGHTSILAAVDLALQIQREEDDDGLITVNSIKTRDMPVDAFTAVFASTNAPDGKATEARFYGMGAPEKALSAEEQAKLCIKRDLQGRLNQSGVVELVRENAGIGRNNVLRALQDLVDEGVLAVQEAGREKLYYKL